MHLCWSSMSVTLSKLFPNQVYIIHASNIYNKSQHLFNIYVLDTFLRDFDALIHFTTIYSFILALPTKNINFRTRILFIAFTLHIKVKAQSVTNGHRQ